MQRNFILLFLLFLGINFMGLGVGAIATTPGVTSDWYTGLDQAPWTPSGWVFGFAWTTIGITFSVFLAKYFGKADYDRGMTALFASSFGLNVGWNFLFFNLHWINLAAFVIFDLALTILLMIYMARHERGWSTAIWALPYFAWLCIATSLNLYICIQN